MNTRPVILFVEEDADDVKIISDILREVRPNYDLVVFATLKEASEYVSTELKKPFLIMCDNSHRNKNEDELRKLLAINPGFKAKSIPFIFYSAQVEDSQVNDAYMDLNVQGFFQKRTDISQIRHDLKVILDYWETSKHPV